MMKDPYENIANAIVHRAAADYTKVLRQWSRYPDEEAYRQEKTELECFFRSDWFGVLTGVDPETLIRRLSEEVA